MFFVSIIIAFLYLICSIFISIPWIVEIACCFGYFLAIYLVTFVALISGFNFIFTFITLLFNKKEKCNCIKDKDVTVLIPAYNAECTILQTLESIKKQKYNGNIYINIIDDGSTDKTLEKLDSAFDYSSKIKIIESEHVGKALALNKGLKEVNTEYFITVDSDTVLHPLAVRNIMHRLINSDSKTAATAGCLFVKNDKNNFITKLQEWDYTLGIFGIKLAQNTYNSTLVTQGAFSCYKTKFVREVGGWEASVGEDIVLTWRLLCNGYKTNFSKSAIGFTEVPKTYLGLGKQRKRWARGMIEAFKKVNVFTSKKLNFKSRFLMFLNLFFPFTDLALLIFIPLGLILLACGSKLLISWISLLVIILGLSLCLLIEIKRKNVLKEIDCKLKRRSILAFIVYILLYTFILTPYCLAGYISELLNIKKEW